MPGAGDVATYESIAGPADDNDIADGTNKASLKKYTLIDNFDKIDLDTYNSTIGLTGYNETITYPGLSAYRPLQYGIHGTQYKPILVAPDLYRFLANRRFFLDESRQLRYPPNDFFTGQELGDDKISMISYLALWSRKGWGMAINGMNPLEGQKFLIDLANIGKKIENNLKLTNSQLKLSDYFTSDALPQGMIPVPWEYAAAFGSSEPKMSYSQVLLEMEQYSQNAGRYVVNASRPPGPALLYGIEIINTANIIQSPWWSTPLGSQYGGNKRVTLGHLDLINALLTYQMFDIGATAGGGVISPKHYYLVGDFPFVEMNPPNTPDDPHVAFKADTVEINSFYNFYSKATEEFDESFISETQLPNIYTFYSYKNTFDFFGLFPPAEEKYYGDLLIGGTGSFADLDKKNLAFSDYYSIAKSNNGGLDPTTDRYKKVVYGHHKSFSANLLDAVKSLKSMLPYAVQIDVSPTKNKSQMMKIFADKDVSLVSEVMSMLANYSVRTPKDLAPISFWGMQIQPAPPSAHKFISHANLNLSTTELQLFELNDFFDNWDTIQEKLFNDDNCVKFGTLNFEASALIKAKFTLAKAKIKSHINKVFQQTLGLSSLDAIKGVPLEGFYHNSKKCHTEIIAFEIAKFKKNSETGGKRYVQSFFIPNIFEVESAYSYLDTQVFYGQDYIYEIFAHTLVVGAKYSLERQISDGEITAKEPNASLKYAIAPPKSFAFEPYSLIVRAPYCNNASLGGATEAQKTTTLVDKPPLPPDISFYPYKNVDDKVLILLGQNYGARALVPIRIFAGDVPIINKYYKEQQYEKKPLGHVIYKSDDGRGKWHVYRMITKPTKWADIVISNQTTVDSEMQSGYEDGVDKNKDYYYFARFEDVHGNISNPTDIFHLRIIKEEGFPSYLMLKTYNFSEEKPPLVTDVPFKKYLKIRVNDGLRDIAGENSTDASIGYVTPNVLGASSGLKTYKFRIISKKSGKKIDINVALKFKDKSDFLAVKDKNAFIGDPQTTLIEEKTEEANKDINQ